MALVKSVGVVGLGSTEEDINTRASSIIGEEELEEGEITGDESDLPKASTTIPHQLHPLEHSWTFWFDSPSSKSKQVAWGSSIHPVHTFGTVEEFWRYFFFFFFSFNLFVISFLC